MKKSVLLLVFLMVLACASPAFAHGNGHGCASARTANDYCRTEGCDFYYEHTHTPANEYCRTEGCELNYNHSHSNGRTGNLKHCR